jgi:hypothetical protein
MPGYGTSFNGPVLVGTRPQNSATTPAVNDYGLVVLAQQVALAVNTGTGAVTGTCYLPIGSAILDIVCDTTTAWNSGTSDTLSVGTAAAGTQYASGVDVKTATGRTRPTFTATQLTNMQNVAAPAELFFTVTQVGTAATTGATLVTVFYMPVVQAFTGNT